MSKTCVRAMRMGAWTHAAHMHLSNIKKMSQKAFKLLTVITCLKLYSYAQGKHRIKATRQDQF